VPITTLQRKQAGSVADAASVTATFDSTPALGSLLIATAISSVVAAATPMSGTGWALVASHVDAVGLYQYYKIAEASEPTAITYSPVSSCGCGLVVEERTGNVIAPFEYAASNGNPNVGVSTVSTGTTPPTTNNNELAYAAEGHIHTTLRTVSSWSNSFAAQAGSTQVVGIGSADTVYLTTAEKALTSRGAQETTATLSGALGHPSALVVTYVADTGDATQLGPSRQLLRAIKGR